MMWTFRQTDAERFSQMLRRAGVDCTRGQSGGRRIFGIGSGGAFHSRSTQNAFTQFEFAEDGTLEKVGIYENWSGEDTLQPTTRSNT